MTPEEFVREISNGISLDGIVVGEDIGDHGLSSSRSNGTIKNCQLKKFRFPMVNYTTYEIVDSTIEELKLENVRIEHLKIVGCRINRLIIGPGFTSGALHVEGNTQLESIGVSGGSAGKVLIHNNEVGVIDIRNTASESIKISGIETSPSINQVQLQGNMPGITIESQKLGSLLLTEVTGGTSKIHSCTITGQITINQGSHGELEFKRSEVTALDVLMSISHLRFFGGKIGRIKLTNNFGTFSTYRDDVDPHKDCKIDWLDLSETSGLLQLKSTSISTLLLNGFTAGKGSRFSYLTITNSIRIENSTIEGARFHNVNLSSASIRLLNSSLSECELINVEWPRKSELYEYSTDLKRKSRREKLNTLWPLKESYRQLKVLSLTQHNKIDALAFQKHELKVYWKIVHLRTFSSIWLKGFGNWLILSTNWLFSDFGQSIRWPLTWLLVFQLIFISSLLSNYDLGIRPELDPCLWEWEATKVGLGLFLNLLNPVHSVEIINPFTKESIPIFGITDFLMRVIDGYLIYYFIRASRKYNLNI